jgi:hypothetical protein
LSALTGCGQERERQERATGHHEGRPAVCESGRDDSDSDTEYKSDR